MGTRRAAHAGATLCTGSVSAPRTQGYAARGDLERARGKAPSKPPVDGSRGQGGRGFLLGHGARVRSSGQQQVGQLVPGRVGDVGEFVEVVPGGGRVLVLRTRPVPDTQVTQLLGTRGLTLLNT